MSQQTAQIAMSDRLLRTESAAAKFDLSPKHFKRMVKDGKLPAPANWIGKELRWSERDLDECIARMTKRETAEATR